MAFREDAAASHPAPGDIRNKTGNFRQPNQIITEYDQGVAARLATLIERRSTAADPDLIRLIIDMLDPPSTQVIKMSRQLFSTPQSREVDRILKQKVSTRMHISNLVVEGMQSFFLFMAIKKL